MSDNRTGRGPAARHRRHERRVWQLGVALIAVGILAVVITFSGGIPFIGGPDTRTIRAEFSDASNVRTGQPVRIHGVEVGKVTAVTGKPGGRTALVTMGIESDKRAPLRSDATAVVRWRTLLGRNMYIDLDPGSAGTPLRDSTLPTLRTDHQFELDQLLTALTPSARSGIRSTISGLGAAMSDADAVARSADALSPTLQSVSKGIPALRGSRPGDLGTAVRGTGKVVDALTRDERALGDLIESADTTVAAVAARKADLAATLRQAPSALAVSRRELAGLETTLDKLDPVAAALRPNAGRVRPTVLALTSALQATSPMLARAQPLLRRLRPALTTLKRAADAGNPLVDELTPVIDRVREQTIPYLEKPEHDTKRPLYTLVGPLTSSIADTVSVYDAFGHSISFEGGVSGRSGGTLLPCTVQITDPVKKLTCENLNALFAQLLGQTPKQPPADDNPEPGKGRSATR